MEFYIKKTKSDDISSSANITAFIVRVMFYAKL